MTGFSQDLIADWKDDLLTASPGEQIYIVSGETNYSLFSQIHVELKAAADTTGLTIKMIAGPVISVDEQSKDNPIFKLVDANKIELYVSPYRQLSHYRVIGLRMMYKESYHEALSLDRRGDYIYDPYIISKHIYDFNRSIRCLPMQRYTPANPRMLVRLTKRSIEELKDIYGKNYDFASC